MRPGRRLVSGFHVRLGRQAYAYSQPLSNGVWIRDCHGPDVHLLFLARRSGRKYAREGAVRGSWPSDRRMDSTGGRGSSLAHRRWHQAARAQAGKRSDREREPWRPGGCSSPGLAAAAAALRARVAGAAVGGGEGRGALRALDARSSCTGASSPGSRQRALPRPSTAGRAGHHRHRLATRASSTIRVATRSRSSCAAMASPASKVLNDAKAIAASCRCRTGTPRA